MKTAITLQEANDLLKKYLYEKHLLYHSRETEVVMRALAKHFNEDEELWGLTGLLHDLDMEAVKGDEKTHAHRTCEILKEEGYDLPEISRAILSHVEDFSTSDVKRESNFEFCLSAAENITGLIVAYGLMRPDKLNGMKPSSLNKKFKDKSFAANVNRQLIADIEKTGLEKSKFFEIAIAAIQEIAGEIEMG